MQNVEATLSGTTLTLTIDLSKELGESGSGKSILVASTGGGISVPGREDIKMNVTIYKPIKRR
jgi:ABC-type dipeptide/oligopeptide/nickel transport system ATPase component